MESLVAVFAPWWPWPIVGGISTGILSGILIERVLKRADIPRESLVSKVLSLFVPIFVTLLVKNLLRWFLS